jgi:hypothetical protein
MAGRGMGAATRGGGCVGSGPRNKVIKETSKTTGPVMMAKGGDVKKKKKKGFPDLNKDGKVSMADVLQGRLGKGAMKGAKKGSRAMGALSGTEIGMLKKKMKKPQKKMGGGMIKGYKKGGMGYK